MSTSVNNFNATARSLPTTSFGNSFLRACTFPRSRHVKKKSPKLTSQRFIGSLTTVIREFIDGTTSFSGSRGVMAYTG